MCLIPASAHGTNAASAVMVGMRVVVVACDDRGNVDMEDLRAKAGAAGDRLAALMVTYPSTHGVFEEAIRDICAVVHDHGGQVYVDGANLNALVGLAQRAVSGRTSATSTSTRRSPPHGGGGPASARWRSAPTWRRSSRATRWPNPDRSPSARCRPHPSDRRPFLPIPWVYIRLMGAEGLRRATVDAIVAANYVSRRLADHFPTLYVGSDGFVAHECILDLRGITKETGVTSTTSPSG